MIRHESSSREMDFDIKTTFNRTQFLSIRTFVISEIFLRSTGYSMNTKTEYVPLIYWSNGVRYGTMQSVDFSGLQEDFNPKKLQVFSNKIFIEDRLSDKVVCNKVVIEF